MTSHLFLSIPDALLDYCFHAATIVFEHDATRFVVLQVYPAGLKVLSGVEEVQDLPIEDILPSMEWRPGVVIAAACILDPFVLLHFSDGSAILLSGDSEEGAAVPTWVYV